jgi:hypothetical protein
MTPKSVPIRSETATAIAPLSQRKLVSRCSVAASSTRVREAKVEANPEKLAGTRLSGGSADARTMSSEAIPAARAPETGTPYSNNDVERTG